MKILIWFMALNLLCAITLDRSYAIPAINNAYVSNLTHATVAYDASLISAAANSLQLSMPYSVFQNNIAETRHPLNAIINLGYGSNFRVQFDITVNEAVQIGIGYYRNGTPVFGYVPALFAPGLNPPSLLVSAGTHHISIDNASGTFEFDEIRVYYFNTTFNGAFATISNLSIAGIDTGDFDQFTTGDRILTYWDDVSNAFFVQREDNPGASMTTITGGPTLGIFNGRDYTEGVDFPRDQIPGDKIGAKSFYEFCAGNDRNVFKFSSSAPSFPYITRIVIENDPLCTINNVVCDVQFSAQPVTTSSDKYVANGTVQLYAYSSHADFVNPIKYSTQSPDQLTGQYNNVDNTSGLFTGVAAGIYTYYAVDRYNCYKSIKVVIPVKGIVVLPDGYNGYNPKYRHQYKDIQTNVETVVDLMERGFTGVHTFVHASATPFVLNKNQGDLNDKFGIIHPTFAVFALISRKHFQYVGIFSQDDRKYLVAFNHDGYKWFGFVLASVYNEVYSTSENYITNIESCDNLANLVSYDFVDASGNTIEINLSLMQVIVTILKKLDLNLNIRSAINQYSTGMASGDADDPLTQTYIECLNFMDDEKPFKCDQVITDVLKPFGAKIVQDDGVWNIVEVNAQTAPYKYRLFDPEGNYLSNGVLDPVVPIITPSEYLEGDEGILFANANHNLDIFPAYGKFTINHKLKIRPSIFPQSMDRWQPNLYGAAGLSYKYYDITGTKNKGLSFVRPWAYTPSVASPFFSTKTQTDSINISFEYRAVLDLVTFYGSFGKGASPPPDPPYAKIKWRLICKVGSVTFYFSSILGWIQTDVIGTSTTSVAIPTTHSTSKTFTVQPGLAIAVGSILKIQNAPDKYFRGIVTAYNFTTGVVTVDSYANIGTGTYAVWDVYVGGSEFIDNVIYEDKFDEKFEKFEKEIELPKFTGAPGSISLQLQLFFEGSRYTDFTTYPELRAIPTAVYPAGYRIRGADPAYPGFQYFRWYTLEKGIEPAVSSNDIIAGNDYNAVTNAVLWTINEEDDSSESDLFFYQLTKVINQFDVQNVKVDFLPNKKAPVETETITYVNNANFKENLTVDLNSGDLPAELVKNKELYLNIFKLADGSPTFGWHRRDFAENTSIQNILMKVLSNQYIKPTWRLSGSWLGPQIKFLSTIKHTVPAVPIDLNNPENPGGSGWTQQGTGNPWTGNVIYFTEIVNGSSLTEVELNTNLISGTRIRVDVKIARTLSADSPRIDRFVIVLLNGADVMQKITLIEPMQSDDVWIKGATFTIDQACDRIGYAIENISGGGGDARYEMDYFRVKGVASVRYYYPNSLTRDDRSNIYELELAQLIPAVLSTDTDIDDTGGGDTGGGDDGNGGGGAGGGTAYSGDYSNEYSGDFNTSLI